MAKNQGATRPRLLVVEDNDRARSQLSRRFEREGFEVIPAEGFGEALSAFKAGFIDAVVADWNLEQSLSKSGEALFEAIRSRDWEVPLVLISGRLNDETTRVETFEKLLQMGSVRYVEKGESYDEMVSAVLDLLRRRDTIIKEMLRRLRDDDQSGRRVATTAGDISPGEVMQKLLSGSAWKEGTLDRLAEDFAQWEKSRIVKKRRS